MPEPSRRLNYFSQQFLHVEDFTTEQAYHLEQRRRHNRALHAWGIAEGFNVILPADDEPASDVRVTAGIAYNSEGFELFLAEDQRLDLSALTTGSQAYITIEYQETTTDPVDEAGVTGFSRVTETPLLQGHAEAPENPGQQLILGRLNFADGQIVGDPDLTERRIASATATPPPGLSDDVRQQVLSSMQQTRRLFVDLARALDRLIVPADVRQVALMIALQADTGSLTAAQLPAAFQILSDVQRSLIGEIEDFYNEITPPDLTQSASFDQYQQAIAELETALANPETRDTATLLAAQSAILEATQQLIFDVARDIPPPTGDEDDVDAGASSEDDDSVTPLAIDVDAVSGIGARRVEQLAAGGITTAALLAAAAPEQVAALLNTSREQAEQFIDGASELLA